VGGQNHGRQERAAHPVEQAIQEGNSNLRGQQTFRKITRISRLCRPGWHPSRKSVTN